MSVITYLHNSTDDTVSIFQMYLYTTLQMYLYTTFQMYLYTTLQMYLYTTLQMYLYTTFHLRNVAIVITTEPETTFFARQPCIRFKSYKNVPR